eukprot:1279662-Pleurochrysis_carterae.AAC.1
MADRSFLPAYVSCRAAAKRRESDGSEQKRGKEEWQVPVIYCRAPAFLLGHVLALPSHRTARSRTRRRPYLA